MSRKERWEPPSFLTGRPAEEHFSLPWTDRLPGAAPSPEAASVFGSAPWPGGHVWQFPPTGPCVPVLCAGQVPASEVLAPVSRCCSHSRRSEVRTGAFQVALPLS